MGQGPYLYVQESRRRNQEAFQNVEHALNSVCSSWKDVYSVASYHVPLDKDGTALFRKLFKRYIGDRSPRWTCMGVAQLGEREIHVEIVVTAYTNRKELV